MKAATQLLIAAASFSAGILRGVCKLPKAKAKAISGAGYMNGAWRGDGVPGKRRVHQPHDRSR